MKQNILQGMMILAMVSMMLAHTAWAEDKKEAQKYFKQGKRFVAQSRFEEALQAFQKSYKLYSHPHVLFNMAKCAVWMGEHDQAIFYYQQFLEKNKNITLRRKAQAELEALLKQHENEPQVPAGGHEQTTGNSSISIPKEPEYTPPSTSEIPAKPQRPPSIYQPTDLENASQGKKQSDLLITQHEPSPKPWYADKWGWTLTGVGAVLLIAGSITYIVGRSIYSDVSDLPSESDYYDRQNKGDKLRIASYLLLGGGGAAIVVGTIKFYFSHSIAPSQNSSILFLLPTANVVYHF